MHLMWSLVFSISLKYQGRIPNFAWAWASLSQIQSEQKPIFPLIA